VADYKGRIERVAQESEQILDHARRAAEADRNRLIAEAELEVERFKAAAMATAQREVSLRRAALEGEVVDRAIARATELLQARFTDADQVRLVDDFAVELAGTSTRATARA
jgi:F-type H+-transporting ATPase subunit b